jgi:hypothetical protein
VLQAARSNQVGHPHQHRRRLPCYACCSVKGHGLSWLRPLAS